MLPRAAARRSLSRPGSGRSPRQHGHRQRSMTTATTRPLSAGRHPVSNAAPRTRRAAQPGLPAGQAPQASTPPSDLQAGCGATSATSAACSPPRRRSTCTAITPPRQSTCAQARSLPVRPGTRRSPPGCLEPGLAGARDQDYRRARRYHPSRPADRPESDSVFIQRPRKKAAPGPGSAPTQRSAPRSAASRRSCRRPDHRETFIRQRLHQLVARAEAGRSGP